MPPETKYRNRKFLYLQTSSQLSILNFATISPVIKNIIIYKSRDNINVKIIEEYIKANKQSNQRVDSSAIQSIVSNNYFPFNEGKYNHYHHSLFAKDPATIIIENIRSIFEKIYFNNKLLEYAVIKGITDRNAIDDNIKEKNPSTIKADII